MNFNDDLDDISDVVEQTPAPVEQAEVEAPEAAEAPEPADDAGAQAEPKKGKTASERIAELTWKVREAERREAALMDRLGSKPEPVVEPKAEPLDAAQYEYGEADPQYIAALVDARVNAALEQRAQAQAAQTAEQGWAKRQEDAAAKHDDFHEVVVEGAANWRCTPVMADAIKTSEAGAEVAYHLAKNPAEAARIASLNPLAQAIEIGRLEGRLTIEPAAKPSPKIVPDTPTPPPTVRGQGGKFKVAPDTDDFSSFEEAYT